MTKEDLIVFILEKRIKAGKINPKTGKKFGLNDIKKAGIKQKVKDRLGV